MMLIKSKNASFLNLHKNLNSLPFFSLFSHFSEGKKSAFLLKRKSERFFCSFSLGKQNEKIAESKKLDVQFDWRDAFCLEKLLTEEERMTRDAAAEFASRVLLPNVIESFRHENTKKDIIQSMGEASFLAPTVLHGASSVAYGLIAREFERIDSGYRSMFSVSCMAIYCIHKFGTQQQKERFLPGLAKGELIGCFALTEPNHGSDPSGMETRAVYKEGVYILNGCKTWITNAPLADVAIVAAKDAQGVIGGYIVERRMKGLSTPSIPGKFSLRVSPTGGVVLEDVRVPPANVLEGVCGLRSFLGCLNDARMGIAWGALGAGEACVEVARNYCLQRKQFGSELASKQLIQVKLSDCVTELSVALQAVHRASRMRDEGLLHPNLISLVKRNSCRKALQAARDCRDMLGGNGIVDEYSIIRHMLNLEAVNTYEGTQDVHALVLGRAITGLQAFR